MEGVISLNGVVHAKFGSVANFARALGWSYSKTNRAVRNTRSVTLGDAKEMVAKLGLENADLIVELFFFA